MTLPDFRKFLPSQVKSHLKAHFLERLETSALNFRGTPIYDIFSVRKELDNVEGVNWTLVTEMFAAALAEYNKKYPIQWDSQKQKAFRRNLS